MKIYYSLVNIWEILILLNYKIKIMKTKIILVILILIEILVILHFLGLKINLIIKNRKFSILKILIV
jgi:hypothetical protein